MAKQTPEEKRNPELINELLQEKGLCKILVVE